MTVLLAFLNFGPYHFSRLAAAQTHGAESGRHVIGLSMARRQGDYDWQEKPDESIHCASPHLPLEEVPAREWRSLLAPILDQVSPDVCAIAGYSHPSMLTLISLCGQRGIPWILMSESQERDEVRRPWQERIKSRLVRLASSALAGGTPHVAYLTSLGLSPAVCSTGYDVVDNNYFASETAKWRGQFPDQSGTRNHERGTNHVRPYFLASNRFIPKKNLFRLLDAYARYADPNEERRTKNDEQGHAPWPLVLLGNGELKSDLLAHAAKLELTIIEHAPWEENGNGEIRKAEMGNLETRNSEISDQDAEICLETGTNPPSPSELRRTGNQERRTRNEEPSASPTVFLPGFRQIDELPRFYAHAGAFVHASTSEQWGLVVNEAMASGLPVIVSNHCGCAPDLLEEGKNGFTFDPLQVGALAELMNRVASLPDADRVALGEAGQRTIADWGTDRFARGLQEAAERALVTGPRRGSWLDQLLLKLLISR